MNIHLEKNYLAEIIIGGEQDHYVRIQIKSWKINFFNYKFVI